MLDRIRTMLQSMRETSDNIAHDLRSPITRMRGMAEMALYNSDSPGEEAVLAGTVVEQCDRLLAMINTMLDISEAESGLARLELQEIDLSVLLRDMADLFQPVAEDRHMGLIVENPGSLVVFADRSRLQRIFANLLDNSLKYTADGGRIRVFARSDDDTVGVSIEDNGAGIPEDELPHIFDRFFRGERSRSAPGTGLGLSLAQALVHLHGGTITAESRPGFGSCFTVTLPR
jgi:signal transduction histidine kinase